MQLVKVADGYHLWSETFDRTLDDIFAVQDDIAQSVVKELRTTLLGEAADSKASGEAHAEVAAAAIGRGSDAEAHRLYLQGRYFVNRLGNADMTRGLALLRQAVALEPGHALAWATMSWAQTLVTITGDAPDGGRHLGGTRVRLPSARDPARSRRGALRDGLDPALARLRLEGHGSRLPARARTQPGERRDAAWVRRDRAHPGTP